mgnify:CR=1 FL=1
MNVEDMYEYYNILKIYNNVENNEFMNLIICPGGGLGNLIFQYFYFYHCSTSNASMDFLND